jgi:uncharacterized protein
MRITVTRLFLSILLLAYVLAAGAQAPTQGGVASVPPTPALTGRVVDDAHLLDVATAVRLNDMLAAHEKATGQQIVVVTLPSLQGEAIEDFGYQLGRRWGIGQKGKDNGALLIVARDDHKVRIEVGYGLEGQLTDAISSAIINQIILPTFRQGNFNKGIVDGVTAIIKVLGGDTSAVQVQQSVAAERTGPTSIPSFIILLFIVLVVISRMGRGVLSGAILGSILGGIGGNRGQYGGFGGGGGFTGGGGSFGGGGASGNW